MFSRLRQNCRYALAACTLVVVLACAASASAQGGGGSMSGGAAFIPPPPPPKAAKIYAGKAIAPASAPDRVKQIIEAGNQIVGKPYRYGGGHKAFSSRLDRGYDCSGSVSFALHGGRFLRMPLDSGSFLRWGQSGPGQWITVYTSPGHAYLVVAGLRFDTSLREDPSHTGPQWSKKLRRQAQYVPRHPRGF